MTMSLLYKAEGADAVYMLSKDVASTRTSGQEKMWIGEAAARYEGRGCLEQQAGYVVLRWRRRGSTVHFGKGGAWTEVS
jgi:hypothetical protein